MLNREVESGGSSDSPLPSYFLLQPRGGSQLVQEREAVHSWARS